MSSELQIHANERLKILDEIYRIYEEFASGLDVACKKDCCHCCTRNVTMTTLEGYRIIEHVLSDNQTDLLENLRRDIRKKRFTSQITTNQLAYLCVQGKEIPDEQMDHELASCPLLINKACPIYSAKPFGCRCMVSNTNCEDKGYAEQDPFVLTVNNVFLQYIEQVDAHGCSGNLTDVLLFLVSEENRQSYKKNRLSRLQSNLVPNRPIPALMIPPMHRKKIKPILNALKEAVDRRQERGVRRQ